MPAPKYEGVVQVSPPTTERSAARAHGEPPGRPLSGDSRPSLGTAVTDHRQARLAAAFVRTLAAYSGTILPSVARELARWRSEACGIPDPALRLGALEALKKRGNMQGAALFAMLAPRTGRTEATRALVSFQGAYNYLDILAERPNADPVGNGQRLHAALMAALDPGAPPTDYYALNVHYEDRGYLTRMVETCRAAVSALPSYELVRESLLVSARRIVDFQSFNLGELQGGPELLESWGREHTPSGSGLSWWETAAAGGSSLGVHALIGLAASPQLGLAEIGAVERAYFPWIGALHSLLDSTVDIAEDRRDRQRNLLGYYASLEQAELRLAQLAERATAEARGLHGGRRHEVVLAAMVGYYLSAPQASDLDRRELARSVTSAAGPLSSVALKLLGLARPLARLVRR
jgi:tetraprenyl-beta-curcumene synthase